MNNKRAQGVYHDWSEEKALRNQLKSFLKIKGDWVLENYLNNGFDKLLEILDVRTDLYKTMLFEYLMVERKALLECIRRNKSFFLSMIAEGDGEKIRPIMGVEAALYDKLWREALDLLSLYFAEKQVVEKMTNQELQRFLEENVEKLTGNRSEKDFLSED